MRIEPEETEIVGKWMAVDDRVIEDEATKRIYALVRDHLQVVASSGWEKLFRDPTDGRYWEQTRPRSEVHGAGPPKLAVIDEQQARVKYNF
jgi:Immunity protein 27